MTTPLALARRLERQEALGCVEYARSVAALDPSAATASFPLAGGFVAFSGPGGPLSRAVALGMTVPVTTEDLDRVEGFYRERGGPAQVDLCPLADRSLVDLLGERAYRISEFNSVLVKPLQAGHEDGVHPPGFEVRETRPDEAELWSETVSAGFAGEDPLTPELVDVARPFFALASATPFLAFVDGAPAGGGLLVLREGLATLLATATVPAFRNRGVQTALLEARLVRAAAEGAALAVCYTLPGSPSQRNVERLGFRVVYTKLVLSRELGPG